VDYGGTGPSFFRLTLWGKKYRHVDGQKDPNVGGGVSETTVKFRWGVANSVLHLGAAACPHGDNTRI